MRPKISVIIPVYNRERAVVRAINSIRGTNVEIVVVDDGSTDGSADAARRALAESEHPGEVLTQDNAGPGAARNTGSAKAQGTYLAFLDSDDYWFPHTLPHLLAAIAQSNDVALLFLQHQDFAADAPISAPDATLQIEHFPHVVAAAGYTRHIRFASCNAVIRRNVFVALGGFTTQVNAAEDTDLFLRAGGLGLGCALLRAPVMMAHQVEGTDQLTGDVTNVRQGLAFLLAQEKAGHYPGGRSGNPTRARLLAHSVSHATRIAFAKGHPLQAYAIYFRHLRTLIRGRAWHWGLRLPLIPLLHLLRPRNFAFRLRPKR